MSEDIELNGWSEARYTGLEERFLRYVAQCTTSDEGNSESPSTRGQKDLGAMLAQELREMGAEEVRHDKYGYVYASIGQEVEDMPTIGFIAHLDTSPDASGRDIKARKVKYEGGDIVLNQGLGIVLKESENPDLASYRGQELIVTDGTTLLGADDKAGVAEIMTAAHYLLHELRARVHGKVSIAFTPDEEIGRGADKFDIEHFGAHWAYTVDGGAIGELEYENFCAAAATAVIKGMNIHPGEAKGKMQNATKMAMEFNQQLPADEVPEKTEGREGFFHLTGLSGDVERAEMRYIIRDMEKEGLERRKKQMQEAAARLGQRYGAGAVELTIRDQYSNMIEQIRPKMHIVEVAREAMRKVGIEPRERAIRGGTDGAQLSFRGLPCPNIFAGGHNFHGRYEYVPVESMHKAVSTILNIVFEACRRR